MYVMNNVCNFEELHAYKLVLHADNLCYFCPNIGLQTDWDRPLKLVEFEGATQADRLAEAIVGAVLSGEFQPGLRLDEGMLAVRYGVSRTPVREALRQLASTGLIEIKPRRGATVASATSAQLETLFGAMAEIEATCARLAAMSMTPIERRRLQSHHETMAAIALRDDPDAYAAANVSFHTLIYLGARNDILSDFATGLRRRLAPFRRAQFRTEGRTARSHAEHASVLKAILAGDAATAHAAMFHHMSLVEDSFGQLGAASRATA
jgi:DNA-binding GntR family transcriptional regulator